MTRHDDQAASVAIEALSPGDQLMLLRGIFVSRYAAVEWGLTRLLAGMLRHESYFEDGLDIRRSFGGRIDQLRKLLRKEGPLDPYRDDLSRLYADYSVFETDRHFLAHGFVRQRKEYGLLYREAKYEFRHYDFIDGTPHDGSLCLTLSELRALVEQLGKTVGPLLGLLDRIFKEAELPEPERGSVFTQADEARRPLWP